MTQSCYYQKVVVNIPLYVNYALNSSLKKSKTHKRNDAKRVISESCDHLLTAGKCLITNHLQEFNEVLSPTSI
jgi:hypothetical protein